MGAEQSMIDMEDIQDIKQELPNPICLKIDAKIKPELLQMLHCKFSPKIL